jgi:hypothetical protein
VSAGTAGKAALAVGVVGLAACAGGALLNAGQFFQSYLLGFLLCFGVAFGCLSLELIHALTGGQWGALLRRPLYAASTTLPALGVLFAPVLLGAAHLYPWARPSAAHDALIQHKAAYLNVPFFAARALLCFAVWTVVALVLYRRAARRTRQRGGGDLRDPGGAMRRVGAPGLLLCGITMTIAAIDWVMSLDPHWFSTLFGLLMIAGQMLSGLCFAIAAVTTHARRDGEELPRDALHDVGNLLLVLVMVWAYLSFSQYLIIYAGNMAEDVPWYVHRQEGGWKTIALSLIALHFIVPFLILLSRRTKRSPRVLAALAFGLLGVRLVDLFWFTAPNFYGHSLRIHWMDIAAPLGIGGVWLFYYLRRLERSELARPAGAA